MTAVAEERAQVTALVKSGPPGKIPAEAQRILDERKVLAWMGQQISNLSWGKALDAQQQRAVVLYCRRYDIDPARELDILGGKLYRNANWYQRKGAELIQAGIVKDFKLDHVEADARFDELIKLCEAGDATPEMRERATWGRNERARRMMVRIQHGIPEAAKGAVVTRIYLPDLESPIEGANWCGGGTRKNDPVGEAEPVKTAETRSARRAWKQLVTDVPAAAAAVNVPSKEADGEIEDIVADATAQLATEIEAERPKQLMEVNSDDPYGVAPKAEQVSGNESEQRPADVGSKPSAEGGAPNVTPSAPAGPTRDTPIDWSRMFAKQTVATLSIEDLTHLIDNPGKVPLGAWRALVRAEFDGREDGTLKQAKAPF